MKKYISIFLCLSCILTLAACGKGKVANPIVLPEIENIKSIDITVGENTVNHVDGNRMSEVISEISNCEPTIKQSIQDFPNVKSYIKIDFRLETGTRTLFAYEDNGKYYIEQPYQGIYEIDSQLYEQLQKAN